MYSCQIASPDPIETEIMSLTTPSEKRAYLENIFRDDQGKNLNIPDNVGDLNRKKIGVYLEIFGYPKRAEVGEIAATAPWVVIHHDFSESKVDSRTKYFPFLFKAFLEGDISDGQMTKYLNRFYEIRNNGERFAMENPYTSKDEINQLISLLDLSTQVR